MKPYKHVVLDFMRMPPPEQLRASREFAERMAERRSVRFISSAPVAFELVENAIRCASLVPSDANQQPWKFVVVKDAGIKRQINEAAEARQLRAPDARGLAGGTGFIGHGLARILRGINGSWNHCCKSSQQSEGGSDGKI
jgi:hypothetical protein